MCRVFGIGIGVEDDEAHQQKADGGHNSHRRQVDDLGRDPQSPRQHRGGKHRDAVLRACHGEIPTNLFAKWERESVDVNPYK